MKCCPNNYYMYYSGTNDQHHKHGVTIILKKIRKKLKFINCSTRVPTIELKTHVGKYRSFNLMLPQLIRVTMKLKGVRVS